MSDHGLKISDIAQPAQADPAAHDDEARMMAERVAALSEQVSWDLPVSDGQPLSGKPLQDWVLRKEDQAAQGAVERGIGYLLCKRELGHGQFQAWLKDHGVSARSAQDAMKVAKLLMALPPEKARRVALLPHRKALALTAGKPPIIEGLFDSGVMDDIESRDPSQIREIVRLQKELEKRDERLQTAGENLDIAHAENRELRQLPEERRRVRELRRAVLEETEQLRVDAHRLQAYMDAVRMLPEDLAPAEVDSIAQPLMYALQSLHAFAGALFERGFATFEDFHADLDVFPTRLSEAEAALAARRAEEAQRDAEEREINRQTDLELQAPRRRGPGRPPKHPTKKQGRK